MPDDNRFAGLSEAVEDDPDEESADESVVDEASSEATDSASSPAGEGAASAAGTDSAPETDSSDSGGDSSTESTDADADDPTAFPFDATEKKTVYVRPETLADLDDARALVDAQLRTDHDVRDLTGREFYDAVFRLAASDTEGLIDEILEAREE